MKYTNLTGFPGPQPDALIVVSGVNEDDKIVNTVEILTMDNEGKYRSRGHQECYIPRFPVETSSATGALYLGLPTVCVGYTETTDQSICYQLSTNGTWNTAFELENPLKQGGASILFHFDGNVSYPIWVFVGGDPQMDFPQKYMVTTQTMLGCSTCPPS